jgi:hypothetical protein
MFIDIPALEYSNIHAVKQAIRAIAIAGKGLNIRYQAATGWAGHHTKQGKGRYSQQMGMHSASLPISED